MAWLYVAECRDCHAPDRLVVTFDYPGARNRWAAEHATALGHSIYVRREPKPPPVEYESAVQPDRPS